MPKALGSSKSLSSDTLFLFQLEKIGRNNPKENPTTAMGRLGFLVIN
jgi:hypothetical protein